MVLKWSSLPFNQKHPVLLPQAHHVFDLVIRDAHHRNLHDGIQSTLYAVRECSGENLNTRRLNRNI